MNIDPYNNAQYHFSLAQLVGRVAMRSIDRGRKRGGKKMLVEERLDRMINADTILAPPLSSLNQWQLL